jgi:hypothetical protein
MKPAGGCAPRTRRGEMPQYAENVGDRAPTGQTRCGVDRWRVSSALGRRLAVAVGALEPIRPAAYAGDVLARRPSAGGQERVRRPMRVCEDSVAEGPVRRCLIAGWSSRLA